MTAEAPIVRLLPTPAGVTFWSPRLLQETSSERLRALVARLFAAEGVRGVEIRRDRAWARIDIDRASDPRPVWQSLAALLRDQALEPTASPAARADLDRLHLDGPDTLPIAITRVHGALSTWRPRYEGRERIRLSHPLLAESAFASRLRDELTTIEGLRGYRFNLMARSVAITFAPERVTATALLRSLEDLWPALLRPVRQHPSRVRLAAAGGLLATAVAAQRYTPVLRPFALAGVVLYSFGNVRQALRDLRHGHIGLPAMYTFGLGLMLTTGVPLNSALFAVLAQSWPQVVWATLTRDRNRHLLGRRRQPIIVQRLTRGGTEPIHVGEARPGDLIRVEAGERLALDGIVASGHALLDQAPAERRGLLISRAPGQPVHAASLVHAGALDVRVTAATSDTLSQRIDRAAARFLAEAALAPLTLNDTGHRNARFSLVAALIALWTHRHVRSAQAIIRPDYPIGLGVSAELAAFTSFVGALDHSILVRSPSVFDALADVDTVIFDGLDHIRQRHLRVDRVELTASYEAAEVLRRAERAFARIGDPRREAISRARKDPAFASVTPDRPRRRGPRASWSLRFTDGDGPRREDPAPIEIFVDEHRAGCIIFTWSHETAAPRLMTTLRRRGIQPVILISDRKRLVSASGASAPGPRLNGVQYRVVRQTSDKIDAINGFGLRTLWLGPSHEAAVLHARTGAITAILDGADSDSDGADVSFLSGDPDTLPKLLDLAREHRAQIKGDQSVLYTLNLLGPALGAFGTGTGLQSGLLSHLAVAAIYLRNRRRLARTSPSGS